MRLVSEFKQLGLKTIINTIVTPLKRVSVMWITTSLCKGCVIKVVVS